MKEKLIIPLALLVFLSSCSKEEDKADAYGNFQTTEIMISSEVSGKLITKAYEEGRVLEKNKIAAVIDTTQLALQKRELLARKKAALAKKVNIRAQVKVQQQQKAVLERDAARFEAMLKDGAATPKQVDDIEGKLAVIERQISSIKSNLLSIDAEVAAMEANIAGVVDKIARAVIYPPITGTVLESYVEEGELAAQGQPLFKMADLQNMQLIAYISGDQLSAVKLGQEVKVLIDAVAKPISLPGTVTWIAPNAEFTPKNIQTREERIDQVYAMKVLVKNDGEIKINMPAEVYFTQ